MSFLIATGKIDRHNRTLSAVFLLCMLLSLLYPLYTVQVWHHDCSGDEDCAVCQNIQAVGCQLTALHCTGDGITIPKSACNGFQVPVVFTVWLLCAVTPVSLKVKKTE
ncbi:MAG: hypothetical protein J6M93_00400 [Succinivibrio sp.]|nr:hypothetical protein [Succinivibrio sp.]